MSVTTPVIPKSATRAIPLILYLSVDFSDLEILGKAYRWPRPSRCPRCGGYRLWGHGYVERYFDGVEAALAMKRWRCPECGAVHTMRPDTHWRGFWADRATILASLRRKESAQRWLAQPCRERQQYWWRGFAIQRRFDGAVESLAVLVERHLIAATHSLTHREIHALVHPPHRIFAFTPAVRGP
jgi:hypothetical protein